MAPAKPVKTPRFSFDAVLPKRGLAAFLAQGASDSDTEDDDDGVEQMELMLRRMHALKASKERRARIQAARSRVEAREASVYGAWETTVAKAKNSMLQHAKAIETAQGELEALEKRHARRNKELEQKANRLLQDFGDLRLATDAITTEVEEQAKRSAEDLVSAFGARLRELSAHTAQITADGA